MAEHRIRLTWNDGGKPFTYEAYPREHQIAFKDGQDVLTASASPASLFSLPPSSPSSLLFGSLSACPLLLFLALCTKKKDTVQRTEKRRLGKGGRYRGSPSH